MAYNTVGGIKNCSCRTVILLQADFGNIKIVLKVYDILVVGTAPAVNRLVIIAYYGYVFVCQKVHKLILLVAGILKLIDHNVLKTLAVTGKHLRIFAEEFYRQHNQIIKVNGIVKLKSFLIALIKRTVHVVGSFPGFAAGFNVRNKLAYFINIQGFRAVFKLTATFLNQGNAVSFIINRKVFAVTKLFNILAQNLNTKGVEGGNSKILQLSLG